jgi:hypothetical protein
MLDNKIISSAGTIILLKPLKSEDNYEKQKNIQIHLVGGCLCFCVWKLIMGG